MTDPWEESKARRVERLVRLIPLALGKKAIYLHRYPGWPAYVEQLVYGGLSPVDWESKRFCAMLYRALFGDGEAGAGVPALPKPPPYVDSAHAEPEMLDEGDDDE